MADKFDSSNNIVDIKQMRQKAQQKRAEQARKKFSTKNHPQWFVFVQMVVFLLVLAYFLHTCRG